MVQRGMTLVELLVALAIFAALLLLAVPAMSDVVTNARLRQAGDVLRAEAGLARSEAMKRNRPMRFSAEGAEVRVIDPQAAPNTPPWRSRPLHPSITLAAATVDFGSLGQPLPLGTTLAVDVQAEGVTCGDSLRCPGLRIDGAGGIRLCSQYQGCP